MALKRRRRSLVLTLALTPDMDEPAPGQLGLSSLVARRQPMARNSGSPVR